MQNKNLCVIFDIFFFFSNVVTIWKVRENSEWIRSRNLKAPSNAIRVQLACTPRKFREGKAGEHTEVKRRGRLLSSLSLANHHFSVSSLCWPHFEWWSMYVCVCVVCMCVCVHLYMPSIVEIDQVTHGQPGRHLEPRSSAFHSDSSSCLYVYVYDTYNVLYRPGGYTVGSPVGRMESREVGRFVCLILYWPIGKFHNRCVCISLFTKVSLFTVYNKFWYEIN